MRRQPKTIRRVSELLICTRSTAPEHSNMFVFSNFLNLENMVKALHNATLETDQTLVAAYVDGREWRLDYIKLNQ